MAEPISLPMRLGEPCWTADSLEATIRTVAAMGTESGPRFLASHAPITHVRVGDGGQIATDVEVFEKIVALRSRENVVLVHGDPGTGKSHLINWIKLRYDHAIASERMNNVIPVLIRRRTGSLKDALEQLVQQLPVEFSKYVEPVRSAIDRISEKAARQKLASAMHLELGIKWQEEGRPRLRRTIRDISEAFRAQGFGDWLCREGGVIDRNIQRLISPSDVQDRESIPEFSADEFRITDQRLRSRALNPEVVNNLIFEFEEDERSAEEASQACNLVLRSALREFTGLGNAQLSNILTSIRQDLKKSGMRLVLLIEDVSTLSVLDDEIVNAVEPQNDPSLCDLTSVLGMTEQAFSRLRDNQYQRVAGSGLILSFPTDAAATSWAGDADNVDRFVARYLNTTRLTEANIVRVADARREGADVNVSACENCPVNEACHTAFGAVELDGVAVGLFPFRPGTPMRLLSQLDETQTGVRQTQRGLLDFVTKPVLKHVSDLSDGLSNMLSLPIKIETPAYWQAFSETYTGGWSSNDVSRMRLFAEAWSDARTAEETASHLKPLLEPLSFPPFSREAKAGAPAKTLSPTTSRPLSVDKVAQVDPMVSPKIQNLLNRLERWVNGEKLEAPRDIQELILNFLRGAIPLEDRRSPAPTVRSHLSRDVRIIRIEDAATSSAIGNFFIDIWRDESTRNLIVALAHYEWIGDRSWDYPDGERHKRSVARWLRANQDRICASFDPPGLSTELPLREASKFLSLAAIISRRSELPSDTAGTLNLIISSDPIKEPRCLSSGLTKLFQDLLERRVQLREFVIAESNVPQGATGGINFIDPRLIIEGASNAKSDHRIEALPEEYATSFWKSRFQPFSALKAWSALPDLLAQERREIESLLGELDRLLAKQGYEPGGDYQAVEQYLCDLKELVETLKATKQFWTHEEFEPLRKSGRLDRAVTISQVARSASDLIKSNSDRAVLLFDPQQLEEAVTVLRICDTFIAAVREFTSAKLTQITGEGDPDLLQAEIVDALDALQNIADKVGGGE